MVFNLLLMFIIIFLLTSKLKKILQFFQYRCAMDSKSLVFISCGRSGYCPAVEQLIDIHMQVWMITVHWGGKPLALQTLLDYNSHQLQPTWAVDYWSCSPAASAGQQVPHPCCIHCYGYNWMVCFGVEGEREKVWKNQRFAYLFYMGHSLG